MSNMNTAIRTTTKTTKGRQKIEIKKIESISNRQVTFTKRRGGLFKKAGELCILTAAEVAVIVKSPGGRTFAFGHPSVGSVVDRYLGGGAADESPESAVTEDCKGFVGRYDEVAQELAAEKKRREMIMESNVANPTGFWWEKPVDELGLEELEPYVAALEELKKRVTMRADELMLMKAASSNSMHSSTMFAMNPISTANSSGWASHHFINQANIDSSCSTKMDPHGYDFGRGHAP